MQNRQWNCEGQWNSDTWRIYNSGFFPREDKVFTMGQNGQAIKLTKVFCRRMFDFIGVC